MPTKRRAKGTGALVKRGKWYYYVHRENDRVKKTRLLDDQGNRIGDYGDAEKRAVELFSGVVAAQTVEAVAGHVAEARLKVARNSCLVSEAWRLYKKSPARPKSSPGTLGNYERNWGKFKDWLASETPEVKAIADIRHDHAERYAASLWSKGIAAPTYNYHIQSCRLVLRVLSRQGGLAANPFAQIRREDEKKIGRKSFTEDEVLKVLAAAVDNKLKMMHKDQMSVLVHVLAWTGLRLIDAAALKWESIIDGLIELEPVKTRRTGRRVRIPVHPSLAGMLEKAESWKDGKGFVMPAVAARHKRNKDGVARDVQRIIKSAGLEVTMDAPEGARRLQRVCLFGSHSFRHTLASFLAARGVPISVLADVIGDNIRTLERYYIHTADKSRREAIEALPMAAAPKAIPQASPTDAERLASIREYIKSAEIPEPFRERLRALAGT